MPKKKDDDDRVEVQDDLFPELDTSKPEQKALLVAARKLAKAKADRDNLLSTSKEKVDGLAQKLIALMHEQKLDKFRYDGTKAELITSKEKVEVENESDDESDDE